MLRRRQGSSRSAHSATPCAVEIRSCRTSISRPAKLTRAGLQIHAGLIVGFDSDDKTAFERQFDFAMRLPVPIFNVLIFTQN